MLDPFPFSRELRCLRNTIHCNLFFTYAASALLWLMTLSLQVSAFRPSNQPMGNSMSFSYIDVFFRWAYRVYGSACASSLL